MKKTNATILIIDDQEDILFACKMVLKKHFETIFTLNNPKKVVELLAENEVDVTEIDATIDSADERTIRLGALCVLEAAAGVASR